LATTFTYEDAGSIPDGVISIFRVT
jgi:hypothetical protein